MPSQSVGSIHYDLGLKTTEFDKGQAEVKSKLSGMAGAVGTFAKRTAIAVAAVGAFKIAQNIGDATKRLDTLNNSARTFANMGFKVGQSKKAVEDLTDSILGLPTPLDAAVRGMTSIAAATDDIGKSQKVFSALNDAILGFGGSSEMVDNAVIQLSQDLAGGRITAQTWLSLLNSGLGPALNAMAKDMGITTKQLKAGLSEGTISTEEFMDSLIKLDKEGGGGMKSFQKIAKDSTNGVGSSMSNMNVAIQRGLANLMQSIGRDNIANAIKAIGRGFEFVITKVGELLPKIAAVAKLVYEFLKPSLDALWTTIKTQLIPVIERHKPQLKALAVLLGVTIVAAVYVLINVLNVSLKIWAMTVNTISNVGRWFTRVWYNINKAWNNAPPFFHRIASIIKSVFSGIYTHIRNRFSALYNVLVYPFKAAWNTISGIVSKIRGAIDSIRNAPGGVVSGVKNKIGGFLSSLSPFSAGGYTGPGNVNQIAGVVHKGEYVVPKSQVDQRTGLPYMNGGTSIYGNVNIANKQDADYFFERLNRVQERTNMGISSLGAARA